MSSSLDSEIAALVLFSIKAMFKGGMFLFISQISFEQCIRMLLRRMDQVEKWLE